MDHILSIVNLWSSGTLAILAGWAVMSPAVRDGIVVKAGLILLCLGHAIVAAHLFGGIEQADLLGLNRARFISNAGLLCVVLGYWWRHRRGERLGDILPGLDGR